MKKFIITNCVFFSVFITLTFFLFQGLASVTKKNADFKIKKETRTIIIGHSHSECAYNDSIIENFENFSLSGESYYYTLPKIKKIIEHNPQIETVLIEFTNNQISKNVEKWIWDKKYISYYYPIYSPFIDFQDKLKLVNKSPTSFLSNLPIVFKDQLKKSFKKIHYPYEFGGFKNINGNIATFNKKKISHKEDFVELDYTISELHIEYLQKIIRLLKSKNVNVILIRTPQHKSYGGFKNESIFQNQIKKKFYNCNFIDLSQFPVKDNQYRDPEHVNISGAKTISIWLNNLLKRNISSIFKIKNHICYEDIKFE